MYTVSIPQAVSTVATAYNHLDLYEIDLFVSIPQAVSTVATQVDTIFLLHLLTRFNTASGKYCCNSSLNFILLAIPVKVSIPQAVSTVATQKYLGCWQRQWRMRFNTASGKYCCNSHKDSAEHMFKMSSFNTASGKYCCNLTQ